MTPRIVCRPAQRALVRESLLQDRSASKEMIWLVSILVTYLVINFLTAALSPTVWMDEVLFTDPAVNLRLLGRFTSSAGLVQSDQDFWSGYPPLYSLLLSAWLWIAPISPTGVRSLNFILMAMSCLALWLTLRGSEIIRSPSLRLIFVLLILCDYWITFSYRSGRPDTIGIFIVSLLALQMVSKPSSTRSALVFVLGGLVPWAGLQLVAYVGVLLMIAVLVTRRISVIYIHLVSGIAAGGLALGVLYFAMGTLTAFVASVLPYTILASNTDLGGGGLLMAIRPLFVPDFSIILLLPILFIVASMWSRQSPDERQLLIFFISAVVAVPAILLILGHFPMYYFWMSFIPMSFLAVVAIDHVIQRRSYVALFAVVLVCAAIIVVGLPARIAIALIEADHRDYTKVSGYVTSALNSEDTSFVDFPAYYPAKLRARKVYLNLRVISDAERRAVTVAILSHPGKNPEAFLSKEFGGDWEKSVPEYRPVVHRRHLLSFIDLASPYHFAILRRKSSPSAEKGYR
jgi:hypothetical protein